MNDEEFNSMFGGEGPDPNKVELDFAIESIAQIFKGLRKNGISTSDAAVIVAQLIAKSGMQPEGENDANKD